jgi:AcrR family transcriptional regulator
MATKPATTTPATGPRTPLSKDRVLAEAVRLADEHGLPSLTMRGLARALGVEAMSLYHHVADKDEILNGMVDLVFAEIDLPSPARGWKDAMRRRAASARQALTRHPWALDVMQSRATPGPHTLRHHDHVLGTLRQAGFPLTLAAHAVSAIDSYVYGFALQALNLPFDTTETLEEVAAGMLQAMPTDQYPHLTEMIMDHALRPGYSYADEFDYGLDLVLDGLERALATP